METFIQIIEFLGTFAAAISGVRLAAAKEFDWFGGYVVGLATAIGGGTLRDVMIDAPSAIDQVQLDELNLILRPAQEQ